MKFTGEYRIEAPREAVWAAINDPAVLRRCIPGCEEIVRNTPTDWTARVTARVGPVKARFTGNIRLEDLDPPAGCRIVGEGSGGAAGFAQGGATVRLAEEEGGTRLNYEADAQIGGKLAQIGSRLIDSFARRYADDFFAEFARVVGAGVEPSPTNMTDAETAGALPGIDASPAPTDDGLGATAVLASGGPHNPPAAPSPSSSPSPPASIASAPHHAPARSFDPQSFTIIVLALLLVFMTVMFALKP